MRIQSFPLLFILIHCYLLLQWTFHPFVFQSKKIYTVLLWCRVLAFLVVSTDDSIASLLFFRVLINVLFPSSEFFFPQICQISISLAKKNYEGCLACINKFFLMLLVGEKIIEYFIEKLGCGFSISLVLIVQTSCSISYQRVMLSSVFFLLYFKESTKFLAHNFMNGSFEVPDFF